MGDGIRTFTVLLWALCAVNSPSYAQENTSIIEEEAMPQAPTLVYGAAKKENGTMDKVLVEQPAGAPNPLGNPIVSDVPPEDFGNSPEQQAPLSSNETAPSALSSGPNTSGTVPFAPGSPQEASDLGKEFQNTLVEGNGMIYDIQAYPTQDIDVIGNSANPETIYSPNVNP